MEIEFLSENDLIERYNEMLDDVCEPCRVGGIEFEPHRVLEELDPVAYNYGLNDYEDSIREDGVYSERSLNKGDFFECPECETLYDYEDEAKECCE